MYICIHMCVCVYIYINHIFVYVYVYKYTHTTLKPNPLIHVNTMCIWMGELVTKLPHNGFILHLYVI